MRGVAMRQDVGGVEERYGHGSAGCRRMAGSRGSKRQARGCGWDWRIWHRLPVRLGLTLTARAGERVAAARITGVEHRHQWHQVRREAGQCCKLQNYVA